MQGIRAAVEAVWGGGQGSRRYAPTPPCHLERRGNAPQSKPEGRPKGADLGGRRSQKRHGAAFLHEESRKQEEMKRVNRARISPMFSEERRCLICILLYGKSGLDPAPAVRFCAVPPQMFDKLRMTDSSGPGSRGAAAPRHRPTVSGYFLPRWTVAGRARARRQVRKKAPIKGAFCCVSFTFKSIHRGSRRGNGRACLRHL